MPKDDKHSNQIPEIMYDANTKTIYKKREFFGKGGFANCYEIVNSTTNQTYAGKIVSKKLMVKENQKEKITQEIQIHQSLRHKNIVGFYGFFEDQHNIYIVLELCKKRSMMELHKRRKALTEPETRYYMKQILQGVTYLHERRIIHRDLKLGNLFLDDDLHVKIGDFGLAARIEYDGERKKTLCGTPNYIAPEILNRKGHSFEVDIWSVGCIMYTLLIGKPPFETTKLKDTYERIKKCEYSIPKVVSPAAKHMIMAMLKQEPKERPKVQQLSHHDFITSGYCPSVLPVSSLIMEPRFNQETSTRKPLSELISSNAGEPMITSPQKDIHNSIAAAGMSSGANAFNARDNFNILRNMIGKVLKCKPARKEKFLEEMSDPAAQPIIWISKWVDYSDKYGFGYQLSDESVGVMFNDMTKLIMLPNQINVHYVDRQGVEAYMTLENYPAQYEKKMKLLTYFSRYMREHLIKTGADEVKEADTMTRTPHLQQWCRSTSGVLMQLTNGTVQMNFTDHTKIILCPLMAAVTYIDDDKSFRTFRFSSIEKNGCAVGLYEKMKYAYDKFSMLLEC
ncbi:serine/threonine-protein kinase polo [Harmonia axyridis]|uniref:serine/threonine-protein kinase polo n=1 Tax=Harmonia axyridis TaxID=115357 RepID=UPI001E275544|nr:serine/threonine-protein kinase polo [Harmonia axyridis]